MFNSFIFNIMFTIVPILVFGGFIFTFAMAFSPKLRSKVMSRQLKAHKYMLDENEDILRELNKRGANIEREGIKIRTSAIKEGFNQDTCYCSSCGKVIDTNSRFCKYCGEEQ